MQYGLPEFASVAEAIVYQQLHGKAAETIFRRFVALAGDPLTPAGILKLSDNQLRSAGLSKQKSSYLRDLASKTSSGILNFSELDKLSDEDVIKHLTQVKGNRCLDSSHVSDLFLSPPQRATDRRLRRADGAQEALQEAEAPEAEGYGKDCTRLGTVSQRSVLVHVAKPRYQDAVDD